MKTGEYVWREDSWSSSLNEGKLSSAGQTPEIPYSFLNSDTSSPAYYLYCLEEPAVKGNILIPVLYKLNENCIIQSYVAVQPVKCEAYVYKTQVSGEASVEQINKNTSRPAHQIQSEAFIEDEEMPFRGKAMKNEPKSHQLTEYFVCRRSHRQTRRNCMKEKEKMIEDAVLSGKEDDFEIKVFPGKGRGVVTTKYINRGDFVLEYHGELIDMEEAKFRERLYSANGNIGCYMYYFKYYNKQYCVDATKETGRLGRLVNHSKKGNLKTQPFCSNGSPHLIFVASRDILPGEELLYDYGDRRKESLESCPWLAL